MKKIYLAGPDVFLPNAKFVLDSYKDLCSLHGFEGLSPIDTEIVDKTGLELAKEIYKNNKKLIEKCDYVLANCNFFRTATVDDGTAWEIGYACAIGKKVFGYISKKLPLVDLVRSRIPTSPHESGYLIDSDGYLLNETFGNSINLMLEFSILESGGELIQGDFETALKRIKEVEEVSSMSYKLHAPDYYQILNVPFGSSEELIKKAYRDLAKIYHPDNQTTGDNDKFREINSAYKVLTGKSRTRYDQIHKKIYQSSENFIVLPPSRIVYTSSLTNLAKKGLMRVGLRNKDRKFGSGIFHDLDIFVKKSELNSTVIVNIPLVVRILCPECKGSNIHCESCNGIGTYKGTRDLQLKFEPSMLIHKKIYELNLSHFRPDKFVHFKKNTLKVQIQVL